MGDSPPSVLVIASDTIGERMAGSGIRYWNLARVVGAQQPVTLATPNVTTLEAPAGVTITPYGAADASEDECGTSLATLIERHDVVVAQHLPYLYTDAAILNSRYLVVDLYAPWVLEKLEYARLDPDRGEPNRKDDVAILNRLLSLGDFFICASERQRDFWLGALAAAGRLRLEHVTADPSLRTLVDVVGFGLPAHPPQYTGPGLRDRFPAIRPDDPILIWNGGLWNWLDPLTAIRAVAIVREQLPTIRLVFMGVRSPGAQVAEMGIVDEAVSLAGHLRLIDRHVFFNDWVPYDQRQNWLLDASAAISLHIETAEARFAYRTRMLDTLWCGLPSIATDGDVLADLIRETGIGEVVPASQPDTVAEAIVRVLDPARNAQTRDRVRQLSATYTWEQVTEPLLRYCIAPWRLGDRSEDERDRYLHELERQYTQTAQYARHLEQVLEARQVPASLASRLRTTASRRLRSR